MSAVSGMALRYKTACAELEVLDGELSAAKATLQALEEQHKRATMRRNESQRLLLEEAKR